MRTSYERLTLLLRTEIFKLAGAFLLMYVASIFQKPLFAQDYSRIEVGAQGTALRLMDRVDGTDQKGGFGLRATYNLSRILALDAEGDFLPGVSREGEQRGGREFTVLAGAKAGWRWRRVALFVKARPGLTNFSNIVRVEFTPCGGRECFDVFPGGHINHFALDLGGTLEINTTRRTFLRFDFGEMLVRYRDREYPVPGDPGAYLFAPGIIGKSLLVTAGISYRFGSIEDRPVPITGTRKWEVGAQYGVLSMGRADLSNYPSFVPIAIGDDKSFGGRLTYNFNRWLSMDGIINRFYTDRAVGDAQRGGKILQGAFGPKAGLRTSRYGVFVKADLGFLSYGGVRDNYFPPFPTTRLTHFAFSYGAVLEYYPSRRTMLRFDLGHTIGFYGAQTVVAPQSPPFNGDFRDPGFRDSGMEFMTGVGWRF